MMFYGRHAARRLRRIARAFRSGGAISPEHARTFQQLGITDEQFARGFDHARVIREVRTGEYYLDEDALREWHWVRLRWALIPIAVSIALIIYAIASGRH